MNPSEQEGERNDEGSRADRNVQEFIREQRRGSTNNHGNMRENPIGFQALAERSMPLGAQDATNPDQETQRHLTNQRQQLGQPLALDWLHQLLPQNRPMYRAHQGSLPQHHEQNVARFDAAATGFDVAHQVEQQLAQNAARRAQLDHIDRLLAENAVQRFETEMALRNLQAQEYNSMQMLPPLGLSASIATTATSNLSPLQQQQQQQDLYPRDEARLVSSGFPSNGHHDRPEVLSDKEAASSSRKAGAAATGDNAARKDGDNDDDDDSVSSLEESESSESSTTTSTTTTTASAESPNKKATADHHKRERDNSSDDDKKPAAATAAAGVSHSGTKSKHQQ